MIVYFHDLRRSHGNTRRAFGQHGAGVGVQPGQGGAGLLVRVELHSGQNNAPYRVITTPDEYAYLSEVEADMVLMAEAMARLTANQDAGFLSADEVYADLGIAPEDIAAADDVDLS